MDRLEYDKATARTGDVALVADLPLVSIVMPVKNEGRYLEESVRHIKDQTYPFCKIEIIVVDGGSSDSTHEVAVKLALSDNRIRLYGGQNVNCPRAMNIGISNARGDIVAKIDAHGYLDQDFIRLAVQFLVADSSLSCVGGQIVPLANTTIQRSNSFARFSKFGVGRGVYTTAETIQLVDTVQCGVYRKVDLLQAGLFDENLQFGEDEELNWRLVANGKNILFHPMLKFHYHVRPTFKSLFKQHFHYGQARVRVVRKHPDFLKIKHCVPPVLVSALILSMMLAFLETTHRAFPLTLVFVYVTYLLVGGVIIAARERFSFVHYICLSLASMHVGYGLGVLIGCLQGLLIHPYGTENRLQ